MNFYIAATIGLYAAYKTNLGGRLWPIWFALHCVSFVVAMFAFVDLMRSLI